MGSQRFVQSGSAQGVRSQDPLLPDWSKPHLPATTENRGGEESVGENESVSVGMIDTTV